MGKRNFRIVLRNGTYFSMWNMQGLNDIFNGGPPGEGIVDFFFAPVFPGQERCQFLIQKQGNNPGCHDDGQRIKNRLNF